MKILLAKDAGYCFGVRDAVNLAYDTAEQNGDVYMLGHIVHNENVVQDLDSAGAKVINSLDDVPENKPILFRAHGTPVETWDDAYAKQINIVHLCYSYEGALPPLPHGCREPGANWPSLRSLPPSHPFIEQDAGCHVYMITSIK